MSFCLGIRVNEGLLAVADTQVTTGGERIKARKITVHHHGGHSFFLMTSGLRSVRDKALTYFEDALSHQQAVFERMFQIANTFGEQIRRVANEDLDSLQRSNLHFNLHALVGGQCSHDPTHKLYLLYPEGNWVEIGPGTPYCIIGESGYGKPILDRTLQYNDSLDFALKVGCLAFDSTRISAASVDLPIDVAIIRAGGREVLQHRYDDRGLKEIGEWWQNRLRNSLDDMPCGWMEPLFPHLRETRTT